MKFNFYACDILLEGCLFLGNPARPKTMIGGRWSHDGVECVMGGRQWKWKSCASLPMRVYQRWGDLDLFGRFSKR